MMTNKIDFVITWVDGADKNWLFEKLKYQNSNMNMDDVLNAANRYRDMETLKYWFRSVEKYAPWVNNIFFITWGHIPEWLNIDNPKLKIVNHKDYIPEKYLPTFNSNVIEMNFHRIKELSEYFVNFNDDMFLTDYIKEDYFFKNGLPCGSAIFCPIFPISNQQHTTLNNIIILNKHFDKRQSIKKNFFKFFNYRYGKHVFRSAIINSYSTICGFRESHSAIPLLKSTMEEIWKEEYELLDAASLNRFRANTDISQWLIEKWNFMNGKFYPSNPKLNKKMEIGENNKGIIQAITNQKYKVLCVNDGGINYDFEKAKQEIISAFEKKFPERSSFEK